MDCGANWTALVTTALALTTVGLAGWTLRVALATRREDNEARRRGRLERMAEVLVEIQQLVHTNTDVWRRENLMRFLQALLAADPETPLFSARNLTVELVRKPPDLGLETHLEQAISEVQDALSPR